MRTFCTIVTPEYLPYARTIFRSFRMYAQYPLAVLVAGRDVPAAQEADPEGMHTYELSALDLSETGKAIVEKYAAEPDALRWSLKSVFIQYLLESEGCKEVIFVDPDVCFFKDSAFLFDLLGEGSVLLSPHWRSSDPDADAFNFELNFRDGMYNGGMIGSSRQGLEAMEWLSRACLYACVREPERGLFVDQKYLDFLPMYFEDVRILRHRGCNVANWNQVECRRVRMADHVLINGIDPIVFIHFTRSTIRGILGEEDNLLLPYLNSYADMLNQEQSGLGDALIASGLPKKEEGGFLKRIKGRILGEPKRPVS